MKVIKRDGRLQDFDINKIMVSIAKASDDSHTPLNSSDVHNIAKSIEEIIKKEYGEQVSYLEIKNKVIDVLRGGGFNKIRKVYEAQ